MFENAEIHILDKDTINSLTLGEKNGVYALLNKNSEVDYVGRTSNLEKRLLRQYGKYSHLYKYFSYFTCDHSQDAFLLECKLFHKYEPKNNVNHPERRDATVRCPVCD